MAGPAIMDDRKATDLRYQLRGVARIPLEHVEDGALVKVRGVVTIEGPPANAPITGTPCAVYAVEATLLPPRPELDSLGWPIEPHYTFLPSTRVPAAIGGGDFFLDDGTVRALVRIEHAQLSLLGSPRITFASGHTDFLASRTTEPLLDRAELECLELLVVPGEILTVYGRATSQPDSGALAPERGPYREVPVRKVFAGDQTSPVFIIQERVRSLDALD